MIMAIDHLQTKARQEEEGELMMQNDNFQIWEGPGVDFELNTNSFIKPQSTSSGFRSQRILGELNYHHSTLIPISENYTRKNITYISANPNYHKHFGKENVPPSESETSNLRSKGIAPSRAAVFNSPDPYGIYQPGIDDSLGFDYPVNSRHFKSQKYNFRVFQPQKPSFSSMASQDYYSQPSLLKTEQGNNFNETRFPVVNLSSPSNESSLNSSSFPSESNSIVNNYGSLYGYHGTSQESTPSLSREEFERNYGDIKTSSLRLLQKVMSTGQSPPCRFCPGDHFTPSRNTISSTLRRTTSSIKDMNLSAHTLTMPQSYRGLDGHDMAQSLAPVYCECQIYCPAIEPREDFFRTVMASAGLVNTEEISLFDVKPEISHSSQPLVDSRLPCPNSYMDANNLQMTLNTIRPSVFVASSFESNMSPYADINSASGNLQFLFEEFSPHFHAPVSRSHRMLPAALTYGLYSAPHLLYYAMYPG